MFKILRCQSGDFNTYCIINIPNYVLFAMKNKVLIIYFRRGMKRQLHAGPKLLISVSRGGPEKCSRSYEGGVPQNIYSLCMVLIELGTPEKNVCGRCHQTAVSNDRFQYKHPQ